MCNAQDVSLIVNGESPMQNYGSLLNKFIEDNYHEDYNLIFYDTLSHMETLIECDVKNMGTILNHVFHTEKSVPLESFVASIKDQSYVVRMPFFRGRIQGNAKYKDEDGCLTYVGEFTR